MKDIYEYRDSLIAKLAAVNGVIADLGGEGKKQRAPYGSKKTAVGDKVGNGKKRRKMSASARAAIGAAQKARWAKFHAAKKK